MDSQRAAAVRQYFLITGNYWAFTLTDGALRMLVVLHFHQLGYTPLQIALLFVFAPVLKGQTVKPRPYVELKSHILGGSGIGVSVRDVDDADLKREKLPALGGAVVEDVQTDSPAAKAGMKAGDVIVSFDGEKVRSARHLSRLIEETPALREIVVPGTHVLAVPPGDPAALADAILRLRDDPALRRRLAEAGARWVQARYAPQHVAACLLDAGRAVLGWEVPA